MSMVFVDRGAMSYTTDMMRIRALSFADLRHLLLALVAFALVFRMAGACEAMAATPPAPAATEAHCADMPAKPGKPVKSDVAACAFCGALPDTSSQAAARIAIKPQGHVPTPHADVAGITGGPAPPPPKTA